LIFLLLYVATVMPYNIAFVDSIIGTGWFYIDVTIDFLFIADAMVNCVTGYYDEDNKLVTSNCKIFTNYLKGWFFIDITASFPFNLIE
jgi:hypothetical protein